MDLKIIIMSDISHTQKDKYIYIWNLRKKNSTSEFLYKSSVTDVERKFTVTGNKKGRRDKFGDLY